jgi:hypothetical protein
MNIEERLDILENAHRELAARNEALFQISKALFPIIASLSPSIAKRLTTSIYDATNEHMDKAGMDDEYQQSVRDSMDELCELILIGANKQPDHPNQP